MGKTLAHDSQRCDNTCAQELNSKSPGDEKCFIGIPHMFCIDGGKYTSFVHLSCNFIKDSFALKLHFLLSGSRGSSSDTDIHDSFSREA